MLLCFSRAAPADEKRLFLLIELIESSHRSLLNESECSRMYLNPNESSQMLINSLLNHSVSDQIAPNLSRLFRCTSVCASNALIKSGTPQTELERQTPKGVPMERSKPALSVSPMMHGIH